MAYWSLFFFILGGFFRRILGRTFKIKGVKIHRFYKLVALVIILLFMYFIQGVFPTGWKEWLCMAWTVGWMIRYNSHSHSAYWILDNEKPDKGKRWIESLLTWWFGKGKYYNFAGNFIGLTFGYLVPAILASITMPYHWFWLAGFTTPLGYTFCELSLGKNSNTEYAECLNGAIVFLLFFVNL